MYLFYSLYSSPCGKNKPVSGLFFLFLDSGLNRPSLSAEYTTTPQNMSSSSINETGKPVTQT